MQKIQHSESPIPTSPSRDLIPNPHSRFRAFFLFSAPVPAVALLLIAFDAGAGGAGPIPIPIPFPLVTLASAVPSGAGDACRSFVVSLSMTVVVDVEFSVATVLEEGEDWSGCAGGVGEEDLRRVAGAGVGTPRPIDDVVGSGGGTGDLDDEASAFIADGVSNSAGFTFGVA